MGQRGDCMTVIFQHLVGDYENTDKVIAYNIDEDWVDSNTLSNKPRIENGTDEPDYKAQFELSGPNAVLINTIERDLDGSDDEANSDTVHSIYERIAITVVAESRIMRIKIEDEINRILWEHNLNSANRLLKSNGTQNSHIDRYEKSEVTFREIDLPGDNSQHLQGSEGFLTVVYYKYRT